MENKIRLFLFFRNFEKSISLEYSLDIKVSNFELKNLEEISIWGSLF